MRVIASSACVLAAVCVATPASADFAGKRTYSSVPVPRSPVAVEVTAGPRAAPNAGEARERIRAARKAGIISKARARQLKREAGVIARHTELYARDGLSDAERNEIETRSLYLMDSVQLPATAAGGQ